MGGKRDIQWDVNIGIYHPLALEKNIGCTPVLWFHHLYNLILSYISIFFIVTGEMTGYWDFKETWKLWDSFLARPYSIGMICCHGFAWYPQFTVIDVLFSLERLPPLNNL